MEFLDLAFIPRRIVSLVPSLTESLFTLGFGSSLVGISDYCIHPQDGLRNLSRVGGTKNPRLESILALSPDLVIANREENPREVVEALQAAGIAVWVTFPKTVEESIAVLEGMAGLFKSEKAHMQVRSLEKSLEWARSAAQMDGTLPTRYFCPIWQEQAKSSEVWWMTFNCDTYPNDLLACFNGENIFASRQRRYPLAADLGKEEPKFAAGRDTRYPRVIVSEVLAAQPEVILLPSEPYAFGEADRLLVNDLLAETPAVQNDRVYFIDGTLITWYGTRLALALQELNRVMRES